MKALRTKLVTSFNSLRQFPRINQKSILLFVAGFAVIGGIIIIASRAAMLINNAEPEQGSLSGCVSNIADSTASGGQAVQFGSCQVGGPVVPADSNVATPASDVIAYGGVGHNYQSQANYLTWQTWGFAGYTMHYKTPSTGVTQHFKGSSSQNDAIGGAYDSQRAMEGWGVPSINGGTQTSSNNNLGLFNAKKQGNVKYAGLFGAVQPGPDISNVYDQASRAVATNKLAEEVKFLKYAGGTHILFDLEIGNWSKDASHTQQQFETAYEALGYETGMAMWGASGGNFPDLKVLHYDWQPQGSWIDTVHAHNSNPNLGPPYANTPPDPGTIGRDWFLAGMFRAHKEVNATGGYYFIDAALGYRAQQYNGASLDTALKWDTQGIISYMSRFLPAATWNQMAPYFNVTQFSWAGTDGTGFYDSTQPGEPTYTNWLKEYRKYGMGGIRAEYNHGGYYGTPGDPGPPATGGQGLWASGNDYVTPAGRLAGLQASVSTDASYSTTIPTISSIAQSRSGSNVTLTFSASHEYGIRAVKYTVYSPDGKAVTATGYFPMTFDLNGGSPTAGIPNSRMNISSSIPAPSGSTVVITAYSTLAIPPNGQQHSVKLSL
jgi:hypothetical protein